jgi:toxin ParE1/3/4
VKVVWSGPAQADLDDLVRYIAAVSVRAAFAQDELIRQAVARLSDHPRMGRPGVVDGTRELVISGTSYIAIYEVRDDACEILAIMHGARRWPPSG